MATCLAVKLKPSFSPTSPRTSTQTKTEYLQLAINHKTQNLRQLETQRNSLNARARPLCQELQLLQEPSSYFGEVFKVRGKKFLLRSSPKTLSASSHSTLTLKLLVLFSHI
ncbi:26S protease regulatory subunit 8 [Puccinia sorghi]|uniref:26S protease regulatory subunit 8 n=1 Tax=Puccinia sorghi TaxID=27349 RepID=A0A0L6V456_9BASI|nr:26S protease regulatory subunit 8 [Puccinia sorghi]